MVASTSELRTLAQLRTDGVSNEILRQISVFLTEVIKATNCETDEEKVCGDDLAEILNRYHRNDNGKPKFQSSLVEDDDNPWGEKWISSVSALLALGLITSQQYDKLTGTSLYINMIN